jgi:molecular chaperone Hsp33
MDEAKREEIIKQYQNRDRVVRILSNDHKFRAVALKNTDSARNAQKRHNTDWIGSFLLARTMSAAAMMANFLKGEERIIVELKGKGPVSSVYGEAMSIGENRGFVSYSPDISDKPIENIGEALGAGVINVTRILYDRPEPVQSILPLQKGDVATDLAYYYQMSEQIPSAVILDVDFNEDGIISHSGGLIVQALPGTTQEELEEVYSHLVGIDSLVRYFDDDKNPRDILEEILPFEFEVVRSSQLDFLCRCSKDSFISRLKTLSVDEIKDMQEKNDNELVCRYCNEHYYLEPGDFDTLIEEMQATRN